MAFGVLVPIYLCMFLVSNLAVASIALGIAILLFNLTSGFVLSSLQSVLPAGIRGMGVAMLMLAVNLIGGGTGPLLVGMLSDYWAASLGDESLRYAMVAGISVMGWGVIHFWMASRHYLNEMVH